MPIKEHGFVMELQVCIDKFFASFVESLDRFFLKGQTNIQRLQFG